MTLRALPPWVVNGVTVTLGLILVQYSVDALAGASAAQAAMATTVCTSLADVVMTTDRVARRVGAAAIASAAAAALFYAARPFGIAAWILVAAGVVFAAMLLMSWGPKAASVAFAANLSLVFAMSIPAAQPVAWTRLGWGLVGSAGYWVWAVVTARLLQRTWRALALAAAAEAMATLFAAIGRQLEHPPDTSLQNGIIDAEATLAERLQSARDFVFEQDDDAQGRRETATLLHLIDLRDLAVASNLDAARLHVRAHSAERAAIIARIMATIAEMLRTIARHVRDDAAPVVDPAAEAALDQLLVALEALAVAPSGPPLLGLSDLLRRKLQLLRELQDLLRSAAPPECACRREDLRRYVVPDEWRPAAVRANLHWQAPVFRHAVRTSLTAAGAYTLARALPGVWHPQWVLLTVVAVMQGSLAQTLLRRNARVAGTVVGCVVAAALLTSSSNTFIGFAFLVAAGVAHAFFGVRYAVTAGAAAVMAITQIRLLEHAGALSSLERLGDTVAGALFGWLAAYALPTWERSQLPRTLNQATDALRAYAAVAAKPDDAESLPRCTRQRAYDAIRAVNATRQRSLKEPADVRVPVPQLALWLSGAYGLMSQLSNLRLTLTLHARAARDPATAEAIATAARELDRLLDPAAAKKAAAAPALAPAIERPLASVPDLLPRLRRALDVAHELAAESLVIRALLDAGAAPSGAAGKTVR